MKVIDEKGRLFGRINVIDFFVIMLVLFSLISMLYFGYRIKRPRQSKETQVTLVEEAPKEYIEMNLKCIFIKINPEDAKLISVGDADFNEKGEKIAEIIAVGETSPYVYEINIGTAQMLKQEDASLKQVPATLKIKAEIRNNNLYYKGSQILYNGTIDFKTDKYATQAKVIFDKELTKYNIAESLQYSYRTDIGADKSQIEAVVVFNDGSSKRCRLLPQYDPPVVLFQDVAPEQHKDKVIPVEFPPDLKRQIDILNDTIKTMPDLKRQIDILNDTIKTMIDRLSELEWQMNEYVIKRMKVKK